MNRSRKALRIVGLVAVTGVLLVAALIMVASWRLATKLIHPRRDRTMYALATPHEDVHFDADGVSLAGWFVPGPTPGVRAPALVLIHGQGTNRNVFNVDCARDQKDYDWRCPPPGHAPPDRRPTLIESLHAHGYAVLAFDLRAHGESGGDACTYGRDEVKDVAAAVEFLRGRTDVDMGRVGIFGQSLGAIVAIRAAARLPSIKAVAMESPFADLGTGISETFSRATGLPGAMVWPVMAIASLRGVNVSQVRPILEVPALGERPLLAIADMQDTSALPDDARRLWGASRSTARVLWEVPDAEHVQARGLHPEEFDARLMAFFDASLGAPIAERSPGGR